MTKDFPTVIDSTMRAAFVACPRKFELEFFQGWIPSRPSRHLHAGAAFAKGLEITRRKFYGDGLDSEAARHIGALAFILAYGSFEVLDGETKSFIDMLGALIFYFDTFPLETDECRPLITAIGPAVEFNFVCELPNVRHPTSGAPILYCGRFDMLAEMGEGLFVEDDKTASQLGPSWANQWRLRSQFTGYVWGAREHGYKVLGAVVRGISILKNGYGSAQAMELRAEWEIQRWLSQLERDVQRMIECWRNAYWDYALDGACAHYGGCTYVPICSSRTPEAWLEADFIRREWNPLNPGTPNAQGK